jgi:hypothetical protein
MATVPALCTRRATSETTLAVPCLSDYGRMRSRPTRTAIPNYSPGQVGLYTVLLVEIRRMFHPSAESGLQYLRDPQ